MKRDTMRRCVRRVFAVACGLVAATVAHAWVPLAGALGPDGPIAITVALAETAPAGSAGDFYGAPVEAMALWNVKLQRVRLTAVPLEGEAWYENGRSELFFDRQMFDKAWPSGVVAVTATTEDRGVVVETDIVFNANERWSVYRGEPQRAPVDLRRVAVHELGHLLGLDHPDEAGQNLSAIMNSTVGTVEGPTTDDEAGVRALYDFGPGAAPVIVEHPKATAVNQGDTVSLRVAAGGRGPLGFEWWRDGVAVAGATDARLKFRAVPGDAGDYKVMVRNAAGSTTSNAARVSVRPAEKPVFVSQTSPPAAVAGSDLVLVARLLFEIDGLQYAWRKDGQILPEATTAELRLSDIQFSDAGVYTATATSPAGSSTGAPLMVTVTPGQPPRFTGDVPASAGEPGGSLLLTAPASGSGPMYYEWRRNGVIMPGKTGAVLRLAVFQPEEAGEYSVTVSNAFGRVTSNSALVAAYDTAEWSITQQPAGAAEPMGADVRFEVETDLVTPSFSWFRDGVLLAPQRSKALLLQKISAGDRGVYSAEVSDGKSRVRSAGARLSVLIPGETFVVRHPAPHTVVAGSPVNLTVDVRTPLLGGGFVADRAGFSYQWFKDGQALAGRTSGGLSFTARAIDAGRYALRVTTPVNTVESEAAEVVILPVAGLLGVHPASALFDSGTPLAAAALGLEAVAWEIGLRQGRRFYSEYFYSKDGVAVSGTPFGPGGGLPGIYTLTLALNGVRETSRPFTLGFYPLNLPVIVRQPRGVSSAVGGEVTFGVEATSITPATYQWYRNGTSLPGATASEYRVNAVAPGDFGNYAVAVGNEAGSTFSETVALEQRGWRAPAILIHPASTTVVTGNLAALRVKTRPGYFRYQWFRNGAAIAGATGQDLIFDASGATSGSHAVVVTEGTTSTTSRSAQVTVVPTTRGPEILFQPESAMAVRGGDVTFSAGADGAPLPDRYQWKKNGVDIPGATDAKLKLRDVTEEAAGAYSVVVTNSVGSVTSRAATLTVDGRGRLVNLATRAAVGRDGDVLFAGFVIGGTEPRQVLVRGIGDQLSEFGVGGVLRDPILSLYDAKGKLMDSNDDWFRLSEDKRTALEAAAKQVGAFAQREDARDGALLATLAPGSYTVKVAGLANTTGVGLVEVYELGKPGTGRLVNLSSRAVVGTGASILIPGLVLNGATPRRLLIRAVGPGLAEFGVAGTLSDPVMTVFRGSEEVARNDNWGEQTAGAGGPGAASVALIRTTMAAVGAFGLKDGSRDAVLLLDLAPGSYTVQVAGVAGATGVALVEVYEVGP